MRKTIALLLAALALLALSGCKDVMVPGNHGSNVEEIYLEILSAERTPEDGTVLEVRWNNETDQDVLYGNSFGIQRLVGGTWVKVKARPNTAFTTEAYRLKAHSTATKTYRLDWVYNVSTSGTYRITAECSFWDAEPDDRIAVWAEFQIGSASEVEKQEVLQIPTNGNVNSANYPRSIRIRDWETWKADYRDTYDAAGQYRSSFFQDKDLLLLLLGEGSSSVRHRLLETEFADGTLSVWIEQTTPNTMTMDLARWYVVVPMDKDLDVTQVQTNPDRVSQIQTQPIVTGEGFREPPKLEIVYDGGQFEGTKGTFSWFYDTGDGTWTAVCADSLHPLQMMKHLQMVSCGSSQIRLQFEDDPDSVSVRCWPDSQWGKPDAVSEAVSVWNHTAELKSGAWIYEVTATWNEDGSSFHGTATYVFYMAPADLHPQPYSQGIVTSNTTVHLAGESFSFSGERSAALLEILTSLHYDPNAVCRCMGEYTVDTKMGRDIAINLTEGFVRWEKGQAELSPEQLEIVRAILEWVEKETKAR